MLIYYKDTFLFAAMFRRLARIVFVSVAVVVIYFMIGHSAAFAGFISISEEEDELIQNSDPASAKTDGEIVDCFDYYHFQSIQTSFGPVEEFYEPGQTVYFKGELINENDYPVVDGYLFVRIARFNENYTQEGHDIVDEFFASNGPQGAEKFYLEGNGKRRIAFGWNAPENLPEGVYNVSFSFIVGKKMNLAGLSFTNEVVAGSTEFEIKKSAIGSRRVFLEKPSFTINGEKYDHIGIWPRFNKDAKVEIVGKLKNETSKKESVKLIYDLYYWDGLDDQNKISSKGEEISIASNSSYSFKYAIPNMDETVYFLKVTAIAGNNQKSIVNVRFVSEQHGRPRINFFSPMKFPVLKGETMTNFACFHNTVDKAVQGKMTMSVFDELGSKIQTLGYEGEVTGKIMAVKKGIVAEKNYDYLRMVASIVGADGREADGYEMIYDCENMDSENKECAKIREEKSAVGIFSKSFGGKSAAFGIIALAAIFAIAVLLRKFFMNKSNKTKSLLMFLFLIFAVGAVVFFAGGAGNYASAESVTSSLPFYYPFSCPAKFPGGWGLWFPDTSTQVCINGYLDVTHIVTRDNSSNSLKPGDIINFGYNSPEPFYYAIGGTDDSPYGKWCNTVDDLNCLSNSYEKLSIEIGDRRDFDREIFMSWAAVKPFVTMESNSDAVVCSGMQCVAKKNGSARLTAKIDKTFARPWFKIPEYDNGEWGVLPTAFYSSTSGVYSKGEPNYGIYDLVFDKKELSWDVTVYETPALPFCEMKFSPTIINIGNKTNLSLYVENDKDGIIPVNCTGNLGNFAGVKGENKWDLWPNTTQTCNATVDNGGGKTDSVKICSATVTVTQPVIVYVDLIAYPSEIELNKSSMLEWASENATSCTASSSPYSSDWSGVKNTKGGPQPVYPKTTTTYYLTCSNGGGSATDSAKVTVTQPVIVSVDLGAYPSTIELDKSSTLTWTSQNATSCTASSEPYSNDWSGSKAVSGVQPVYPQTITTYTYYLTCSNGGGSATDSAKVTVTQPVIVSVDLGAYPSTIELGKSSTLTWTSQNADYCTVSSLPYSNDWSGSKAVSGVQLVYPQTTTTYSLFCSKYGGGNATDHAMVTVNSVWLSASPKTIDLGNSSTLQWGVSGFDSCEASGGWSGDKTFDGGYGKELVSPKETTEYILTCSLQGSSEKGVAKDTVAVKQPKITLSAKPGTVTFPKTDAVLEWNAEVVDKNGCVASSSFNDWVGKKAINGKETIGDIWTGDDAEKDEFHIFTLSCKKTVGTDVYPVSAKANVIAEYPKIPVTINRPKISGSGRVIIKTVPYLAFNERKDTGWFSGIAGYLSGIVKAGVKDLAAIVPLFESECVLYDDHLFCSEKLPLVGVELTAVGDIGYGVEWKRCGCEKKWWLFSQCEGEVSGDKLEICQFNVPEKASGVFSTINFPDAEIVTMYNVDISKDICSTSGKNDGAGEVLVKDANSGETVKCDLDSQDSPCALEYEANNSIVVSATGKNGAVFNDWSGDCSGSSSCTLQINSDKNIGAEFCSELPPVSGTCKTYSGEYSTQPAVDTSTGCTAGIYADTDDTLTDWKWDCNGLNGGINAFCVAVKVPVNNPPVASLTCDQDPCEGYKGALAGTLGALRLDFSATDPDNNLASCDFRVDGINKSTSCNSQYYPTTATGVDAGSHTSSMTAIDSGSLQDTELKSFLIKNDILANFTCSLDDDSLFQENCSTLKAPVNALVYFRDASIPSEGASISNYSWVFQNGNPNSSGQENPNSKFMVSGSNNVTLTVVDNAGRSKSVTKPVGVGAQLKPLWKEVIPR